MPPVVSWRNAARPRPPVGLAVTTLRRGGLIVVPTETTYAAAVNALDAAAVGRLTEAAGRPNETSLALAWPDAVHDWVPGLGSPARRLVRRCWPGPVRFRWPTPAAGGLADRLPTALREPAGLTLWAPHQEVFRAVLRRTEFPLACAEIGATSADEAAEQLGGRAELVLDGGPTRFGQPATLLELAGTGWRVLREGVVSAEDIHRQSACLVVFVCTGNTCRSPLAEALFKQALAERLGCGIEDLPGRGFWVLSAGLAAARGEPANPEAVAIAAELGADLSRHGSRPVSADLLAQADYIVTMTRGHQRALAAAFPDLPAMPRLLCGDDLDDPIGGDAEVYRSCAQTICAHLDGLVAELAPQ